MVSSTSTRVLFHRLLNVFKRRLDHSIEMGILIITGVAAVAIGLTLLVVGGVGHQPIKVNLREGSILSQAWFIILVLGFTLIALDVYLTTMHP